LSEERFETLHRDALVVDTHCDTLKSLYPGFPNAPTPDRSAEGLGARSEKGHVDIPRLREGGVDCQVFAISAVRTPHPPYALRTALRMLDIFYRECDRNSGDMVPATSASAIREAVKEGKIAALLSVEGAEVIEGDLSALRMLHRLGVRMVGLTWSFRNLLADGVLENRTGGGLSRLGVEVVEELNRLGVVVDVSHLSDAGFWDVVEVARGPVVASHSNCRDICSHPRNLTDRMIEALAERGGVVGMNFAPSFVDEHRATVERVADHIDHIVDLVGVDHVGLGSDFDGIRSTPQGLEDVSRMPNITRELVRRGYSDGDVEAVLGGNHLRVFEKVIG